MTPEQALNLLDQAAKNVNANRETHDSLKQAVSVLLDIIKKSKEKKA